MALDNHHGSQFYCAWCPAWWPIELFGRKKRKADGSTRNQCKSCAEKIDKQKARR